jgi:hypothetical protein
MNLKTFVNIHLTAPGSPYMRGSGVQLELANTKKKKSAELLNCRDQTTL